MVSLFSEYGSARFRLVTARPVGDLFAEDVLLDVNVPCIDHVDCPSILFESNLRKYCNRSSDRANKSQAIAS